MHHTIQIPEQQGRDKSKPNKRIARWSNALDQGLAKTTYVYLQLPSVSLLHENFARGDTSDLPRLSDAKVVR